MADTRFNQESYRGNDRGYDRNREFDRNDREDDRNLVGRDFMTNEHRYSEYGDMGQGGRIGHEPNRSGPDYRGQKYGGGQQGSNFGTGDYRRTFSPDYPNYNSGRFDRGQDRGGQAQYLGESGGSFGDRNSSDRPHDSRYFAGGFPNDRGQWGRGDQDRGWDDRDRTRFDESIAGRSYYGSDYGGSRERSQQDLGGYWNSEVNQKRGEFHGQSGRQDWTHRDRNRDFGSSSGFGERGSASWGNSGFGSRGGDYYNNPESNFQSYNPYGSNYDRGREFGGGGSFGSYSGQGSQSRFGQFSGRGPKNYQRSDERIREDVIQRLTDHPEIDASEIDVQVRQGEVVLTGAVEDRGQKRLAEDILDSVWGARDIKNDLKVTRPSLWDRITGQAADSGQRKESTGVTTPSEDKRDKRDKAA